jgi:hypothetical protein
MKESTTMASRVLSLPALTALGIVGLLVALTPAAPAIADEDPGYRAPRVRTAPPPQRVRTVTNTRTVWRTRTVCYDYNGQAFDCRTPAPAVQRYVLVGYTYGSSCSGCAAPAAAPVILQQPAPQYYAPPAATHCGGCGTAYLPPPPPPRYSGCGGCAPAVAAPPYMYVQGRHGHGYHRHHHGHPHGHYGHAAQ